MDDYVEGVNLKNFEYMRQNTLFFTNVKNMWGETKYAIPAITSGEEVTQQDISHYLYNIELTFLSGEEKLWSESDTIFSMMKNANQNVAIVGWYFPYCKMFFHLTYYCVPLQSQRDFLKSLWNQILLSIPYYRRIMPASVYSFSLIHQKAELYMFSVLNQPDIDFIYLHDPIPHFPSIWNAKSQKYRSLGSYKVISPKEKYFNNVQLADDFLGRIITLMKEKSIWDASTVIIGTDHRWRAPYDENLLKNIPLLIKFPNQKTGYQYNKEVLPTQIKSMIEQIAINKMHNPVTFMHWLDQQTR